jgi:acetyltransferase-like isoleucine patch superfamily enzyme
VKPASISSLAWAVVAPVARIPGQIAARVAQARKRRRCSTAADAELLPSSRIENCLGDPSAISVGANSKIAGQLLVFAHGGKIQVGAECFVGEGTRIWSANSITIGDRVLISHNVNIHDTNSHSLSANLRNQHLLVMWASGHPAVLPDVPDIPIVVEDDAWIGFNATVLKGVRIGRGAVVGAGALVTKDVLPFTVVVGNPARCVGSSRP